MLQPYNFKKIDSDSSEYAFVTSSGMIYSVAFVKADYYFPKNESFKNDTFELIIQLDESQKNTWAGRDLNIPSTIAAIFKDFFKDHEKVVVFSCDTTDGKQGARNRKFDDWFKQFDDDSLLKLNETIFDIENQSQYFMSMIFSKENPHKNEIVIAFKELTKTLSEAK
ncbi:MAG: DUF6169 family protein [Arcicella sp.]|nr:DUF6169 family protein [Arcicella sp.]